VAVAQDLGKFSMDVLPNSGDCRLIVVQIISIVLGILLALGTWIIRGSLFLSGGGIVQNYGDIVSRSWILC